MIINGYPIEVKSSYHYPYIHPVLKRWYMYQLSGYCILLHKKRGYFYYITEKSKEKEEYILSDWYEKRIMQKIEKISNFTKDIIPEGVYNSECEKCLFFNYCLELT